MSEIITNDSTVKGIENEVIPFNYATIFVTFESIINTNYPVLMVIVCGIII